MKFQGQIGGEWRKCSNCKGKGILPSPFGVWGRDKTCPACGGEGNVLIPIGAPKCARCGGSGRIFLSSEKGIIDSFLNPIGTVVDSFKTKECPGCGGTGFAGSKPDYGE